MQFLIICRPAGGGDPDQFKRLVPFETESLREQKERGTLPSTCKARPSQARQNRAIASGSSRAAARAWRTSGAGALNRAARRLAS